MKYVYVCISFKNYVDAKSFERTRKYKKAVELGITIWDEEEFNKNVR